MVLAAAESPAGADDAALAEVAGAEAAGAEEDAAAELGGALAAEPPPPLLPHAARVTPSAAHARRITGDLEGLIATFSYSRPGPGVQLILSCPFAQAHWASRRAGS
jgi:hypothetical protein